MNYTRTIVISEDLYEKVTAILNGEVEGEKTVKATFENNADIKFTAYSKSRIANANANANDDDPRGYVKGHLFINGKPTNVYSIGDDLIGEWYFEFKAFGGRDTYRINIICVSKGYTEI